MVVQQVNKEWDINKDTMDAYVTEYASSRTSSRGWKFTMWFGTTMCARMCYPNWVLIELMSHREFSFTSCITLASGYQTQVPSLRVPRNPTERS
jgi:hypothetical protein